MNELYEETYNFPVSPTLNTKRVISEWIAHSFSRYIVPDLTRQLCERWNKSETDVLVVWEGGGNKRLWQSDEI
jgi:hypothetical protein